MSPLARKILDRAAAISRDRQIAARVAELRRLGEDASEHYERALAASGLPRAHFNLRLQLLGRLPPPPRKGA
jgi:hypothetical protein